MSRLVATLAPALLVVVLAACGSTPVQPSVSPSQPAETAAPTPIGSPEPSEAPPSPPTATPEPTASPTLAGFTADEQSLIDGIRRGATDCQPVRDALPTDAVAGIECASDDPAVARIGFYLFPSDEAMLSAYFARMDAEGVEREVGGCIDGEGEGSYIPYEGPSPDRDGCFVNAEGFANYRATISGSHVYIGILGRSADMRALDDFAWLGSQDTPGTPTLWIQPGG